MLHQRFAARRSAAAVALTFVLGSLASAQCPVAKVSAQDSTQTERLGWAVATHGDWLFVSDPYTNFASSDSGAVFVYNREGPESPWKRTQILTQPTPVDSDLFGYSLAVDGDVLLVGAVRQSATGPLSGAAHVFRRNDSTWSHAQTLSPPNPTYKEEFGYAVDVEGGLLVVGAPSNGTLGIRQGAVYVWRDLGFGFATFEAAIYPTSVQSQAEAGTSVATDGVVIVAGAPFDTANGKGSAGSVVQFGKVGGVWIEQQRIVAPVPETDGQFGTAIDLAPSYLAAGSPRDDTFGAQEGTVFLYARTAASWSLAQSIAPAAATLASTVAFGSSVAMTDDALVVGYLEQCCQGDAAGVAFWERNGAIWTETKQIFAPEGGSDDKSFGFDVAITDELIVVGAPEDSDPLYRYGSAVIFDRTRTDCLYASPVNVPVGQGATVSLRSYSEPANAGDLVMVLGSATSSLSTISIDGVALPLTLDAYTVLTAVQAGSPTFSGTVATFNGAGQSQAFIAVPAGLPTALVGVSLYHAYARVALDGPVPVLVAASNPIAVRLGN
ncbi:hypothetical protein [Engelhardtia mirabilis]